MPALNNLWHWIKNYLRIKVVNIKQGELIEVSTRQQVRVHKNKIVIESVKRAALIYIISKKTEINFFPFDQTRFKGSGVMSNLSLWEVGLGQVYFMGSGFMTNLSLL